VLYQLPFQLLDNRRRKKALRRKAKKEKEKKHFFWITRYFLFSKMSLNSLGKAKNLHP